MKNKYTLIFENGDSIKKQKSQPTQYYVTTTNQLHGQKKTTAELNKILKPKLEGLLKNKDDIERELINEKYIGNTLIENGIVEYINEEKIEINQCPYLVS